MIEPLFLSNDDIASLERATLDAVAPAAVEALDAWLLPMDHSTIGRAKSAAPVRHSDMDADLLPGIAARYQAWGIVARFRVADVPGLDNIHQRLRIMGYVPKQPTLVQIADVVHARGVGTPGSAEVHTIAQPAWASVYTAAGFDPVDGKNRVQALSRSKNALYACVQHQGQALAAGTANLSHGWASIHGMRTVPNARGQGLATQIVATLADIAALRGYRRMFLQVEHNNKAALALYARAGFKTAWRYHYWSPE